MDGAGACGACWERRWDRLRRGKPLYVSAVSPDAAAGSGDPGWVGWEDASAGSGALGVEGTEGGGAGAAGAGVAETAAEGASSSAGAGAGLAATARGAVRVVSMASGGNTMIAWVPL